MGPFGPESPILFGDFGNHRLYGKTGWSASDDIDFTWTDGTTAVVSFRLSGMRRDAALTIAAFPYVVPGRWDDQEAFVYMNGLFLAYLREREGFQVSCLIDRDKFSTGTNTIAFALPRAISPSRLGLSGDVRMLGLAVSRLELGFL
jgi:hypothetical protein